MECGLRPLALLASVLVFLPCACSPRAVDDRPSLVLVTIDTLRADRLGLYGYELPTSPNIDAIGAESVVFGNAISTGPSTAPATASLLTGVYHASHKVFENGAQLPEDVTTIAEVLRDAGYATAAVVTNPMVGKAAQGFRQGFDDFRMPPPAGERVAGTGRVKRRAEQVTEAALELLDANPDRPLFLWLHLMDPHGPYAAPTEYARELESTFAPEHYEGGNTLLTPSGSNYGLGGVPRYQAVPDRLRKGAFLAAYDTEIHYADSQIGVLVEALRSRGRWDGSVFALTADHGESLGEHDYYFQHGWFAYDNTVRVPLLLRAPGLGAARVDTSISLVDLAPTLLELVGVQAPNAMEGSSLLPVVHGEEGDRPAFSQNSYGNQLTALRVGARSFIFTPPPDAEARKRDLGWRAHWPASSREELYDLGTDPGEVRNLVELQPDAARTLRAQLQAWLAEQQSRAGAREPGDIDPQMEDDLRALGYLE